MRLKLSTSWIAMTDNDRADEDEDAHEDENENSVKPCPGRLYQFRRALVIQARWSVLLSLMESVSANLLAGLCQPSSSLRRRLSPMGLGSNCPKILIVGLPF